MNEIEIFAKRLLKIGIQVEFIANYPWIYLDSVNGNKIKDTFYGNRGFTAFFLNTNLKSKSLIKYKITDIDEVFKKIREYR